MNKTFRVVFNRARGALMVANEVTSSVQKKGTKTMVAVAAAALMAGAAAAAEEAAVKDVTVDAKASAELALQVEAKAVPSKSLIQTTATGATVNLTNKYASGTASGKVSYEQNTVVVKGATFDGVSFDTEMKAADGKYLGAFATVSNGKMVVDGASMTGNQVKATHGLILADAGKSETALTVMNSKFADNVTANGVIEVTNQGIETLAVKNSQFTGNKASFHGGAIRANNVKNLSVEDATFEDNTAEKQGGAMLISAVENATISGSEFVGNVSNLKKNDKAEEGNGGGAISILSDVKNVTIKDSTFEANKAATAHGGAIAVSVGDNTKVAINGSSFSKNEASQGGAIYVWGNGTVPNNASVTITDTDFIGNTATGWGGAIMASHGAHVDIKAVDKDVTFSGNKSGTLTTEGAGARYEMTGDAIYINGNSKVHFNAAEDRTINVADSIVAYAGSTIAKDGKGKLVAADMAGFVGTLKVDAGSMVIAGGIGEYDLATQAAVNKATSKDATVNAGAGATSVTVAAGADLTMGDVVINRAAGNEAGTTFTNNGGKLTMNSLTLTTRTYADKKIETGETAASVKTSGIGSITGDVTITEGVTLEAGTALTVAGDLTAGSLSVAGKIAASETPKVEAVDAGVLTLSGTADVDTLTNAGKMVIAENGTIDMVIGNGTNTGSLFWDQTAKTDEDPIDNTITITGEFTNTGLMQADTLVVDGTLKTGMFVPVATTATAAAEPTYSQHVKFENLVLNDGSKYVITSMPDSLKKEPLTFTDGTVVLNGGQFYVIDETKAFTGSVTTMENAHVYINAGQYTYNNLTVGGSASIGGGELTVTGLLGGTGDVTLEGLGTLTLDVAKNFDLSSAGAYTIKTGFNNVEVVDGAKLKLAGLTSVTTAQLTDLKNAVMTEGSVGVLDLGAAKIEGIAVENGLFRHICG